VQKTGGEFQYGLSRSFTDYTFDGSDLGNQSLPGFNNNRAFVVWQLLKPYKRLQEANASVTYDLGYDSRSNSLTRNEIKFENFFLSKEYNAIFSGIAITPTQWNDNYEPRVPGRFYKSLRYYYFSVCISTYY